MSIIAGQKIKIITGNETEARSETKVTPQMLQYLYVLQMNGPDFDSYIRNAVDENPMLEYKESAPDVSADASDWPSDRSSDWQSDRPELHNGLSGEYSMDNIQTAGAADRDRIREIDRDRDRDRERDPLFNTAAAEPGFDRTLEFELKSQLEAIRKRTDMAEPLYRLSLLLISNIDGDGYLPAELIEQIGAVKAIGRDMAEEALNVIQSMSPAGVGARDDRECIRIQEERGVHVNLRPGRAYEEADRAVYIYPDIYIKRTTERAKEGTIQGTEQDAGQRSIEGTIQVTRGNGAYDDGARDYVTQDDNNIIVDTPQGGQNDVHLSVTIDPRHEPDLELSSQYLRMLETTQDQEAREYLKKKKEQAEWLFACIERRYATLKSIAKAVAELQYEFLSRDDGTISPVTLKDIADKCEVHESTVSRAIRDKYVSTDKGTYPLAAFVPRARSSNADTLSYADIVKRMIREIIYGEDKSHPVSDQKIADKLAEAGYSVSRRAVAKYRTQLGIPNTQARR